jgi:hypothetical protein
MAKWSNERTDAVLNMKTEDFKYIFRLTYTGRALQQEAARKAGTASIRVPQPTREVPAP